jgi:hypothetical protein
MALAPTGEPCADDARSRWTFRESYYDETIFVRPAEHEITFLGQ